MIKQMLVVKGVTKKAEIFYEIEQLLKLYPSLELEIRPVYDERTGKQNSLFHVWLREICEQSGLYSNNQFKTKEQAENFVKEMAKQKACLHGYPYKRNKDGTLATDDHGNMIPLSTKEASISDFKLLMDSLKMIALDNGYILTRD